VITRRVALGYSLLFSVLGVACGDDEGDSRGATCEQVCRRMEAPGCENAAPNCVEECEEEKLNTAVECQSEMDALTTCFAGATFQCDEHQIPMAKACESKLNRWLACAGEEPLPVDDDEQQQDDDGKPGQDTDGEQNLCEAAPDDDACDTCLKGACCEETAECGPDCQRIADCVQECPDDECVDTCVNDNLDGAYQFSVLATCMVQNCAGSCELGE
jgi:hypothetical protein